LPLGRLLVYMPCKENAHLVPCKKEIFIFYFFFYTHRTNENNNALCNNEWQKLLLKYGLKIFLLFDLRPARESFTHEDITITGEGLQNLGLGSELGAFE
jgi:hypothetical protein